MLRRAKELNPNAVIIACGCYSQVAKEEIEKMPEVDIILGVNEKNKIVDIIKEYEGKKDLEVSDVMNQSEFLDFGPTTYTELNRAIIKVQDGCDRFCSYCIIPYARGRVRSRKPDSILKEIEEISKEGIKEVVITGIHLASYGKDFKNPEEYREKYGYNREYVKFNSNDDLHTGGFRLIELLEQINKIKGIERIRLGSLEPKLITKDFIERLSKLEKICPHFHLSLQNLLRKTYIDVMLTTDIIVGFPGETDEDFESTYKFLEKIKFYKMHIFKYSPKKGTVAEKMVNQVDGSKKEERSKRLLNLSDKYQNMYNEENLGKNLKVLIEEKENGYLKGHTSNYIMCKIKSEDESYIDKIIEIVGIENDKETKEIIGKIVKINN